MAIAFQKYVLITSGIAGTGGVKERDLIGRLFTDNHLVPTGSILEFTSASDVSDYFGSDSDEYLRAAFYFGWISKSITAARKISFARFVSADVAPEIFGSSRDYSFNDFVGISDGSFNMVDGAAVNAVTSVDFSLVASLADVASTLQAAIQAIGTGYYTAATVSYNATAKRFEFVGGATGATAAINVTANNAGTSIRTLMGWGAGAIFSKGAVEQSITDLLVDSTSLSDNFGSFCFVQSMTTDQYLEAAVWLGTTNFEFMYCVPEDIDGFDPVDYYLDGYAGTAVTATNSIATEYPEMIPMIIFAATDYNLINTTQNYMYQVFPTVTPLQFNSLYLSTAKSDELDASRLNYYAATQTAGQLISFYQRGLLQGGITAATDQNIYANEIWLKATAGTTLLNLLLALTEVPANAEGRAIITAVLQDVINRALNNGVISVGKTLNINQKLAVTQISGDDTAWYQVQNIGYWLDVAITSVIVESGATEYEAVYTLIYSKDDTIRKVVGRHVLI